MGKDNWITGGNEYFISSDGNLFYLNMIEEIHIHTMFSGSYDECIETMNKILEFNFEDDYLSVQEYIEEDGVTIKTVKELRDYIDKFIQ